MRILLWHVHGGYSDSLAHLSHEMCFLSGDPADRPGRRLRDPGWPASASYVRPEEMRREPPDLVLIQRLEEIEQFTRLLGRRPGRDLPAIFLEHNTPRAEVPNSLHPLADAPEWLVVHVSHFNHLFWDCGRTPTVVVEHGVPDPGPSYTGELRRQAFVVNEPVRRWRVTGSDLLPRFDAGPVDAYGIDGDRLPAALGPAGRHVAFAGNLDPESLLADLARRRLYLHLNRWTSLGLSLLQAMHLGLPVVVLATTEAVVAVPPEAGAISTDVDRLSREARVMLDNPAEAARRGRIAREAVLARYALDRFLTDWHQAIEETTARWRRRVRVGARRDAAAVRA